MPHGAGWRRAAFKHYRSYELHGCFARDGSIMNVYFMLLPLVLLLLPAVYFDVTTFTIPNVLTLGGCIGGLLLASVLHGWHGLANSTLALLVGFFISLLFWRWGWLGAGDVKLLAAVGSVLGIPLVFWVLILTALSGLLLSLGVLARHGQVRQTMVRIATCFVVDMAENAPVSYSLTPAAGRIRLPYALAIALGSFASLFFSHIKFF
jgi:prepilin peptidase CpaA